MGGSSLIDPGAWKALTKLGSALGDDAAAALKVIRSSAHSDDFLKVVDSFDGSADDFIRRADEILARVDPGDLDDAGKIAARALFASEDFIGGVRGAKALGDFTDEFETLAKSGEKFNFDELVARHPNLPNGDPAIREARELAKNLDGLPKTSAKKSWLGASASRGERLALGSVMLGAPIAFLVVERETGGAISHAIFKTSANQIIDTYKDIPPDERKEWLANKIDTASVVADLLTFNLGRTIALNGAVEISLKNGSVQDAKEAAIKFTLVTSSVGIGIRTALRMQIIDEVEKDLSETDRNKLIAEGLIEDIIKDSRCSALGDNEINAQDIVDWLGKKPDGFLVKQIPERLQNGLVQLYPELREVFPDPTLSKDGELAAGTNTTATTIAAPDLSNLTEKFEKAAEVTMMSAFTRAIGKWVMDGVKWVLGKIGINIKNPFNDAAELSNPKYNPEITPAGLRARIGDNLVGGGSLNADAGRDPGLDRDGKPAKDNALDIT